MLGRFEELLCNDCTPLVPLLCFLAVFSPAGVPFLASSAFFCNIGSMALYSWSDTHNGRSAFDDSFAHSFIFLLHRSLAPFIQHPIDIISGPPQSFVWKFALICSFLNFGSKIRRGLWWLKFDDEFLVAYIYGCKCNVPLLTYEPSLKRQN